MKHLWGLRKATEEIYKEIYSKKELNVGQICDLFFQWTVTDHDDIIRRLPKKKIISFFGAETLMFVE